MSLAPPALRSPAAGAPSTDRELPALRLVPIPPNDPPFDDEAPVTGAVLRLVPPPPPVPLRLLPAPTPAPHLRVVADLEEEPGGRTATSDLPPARPFALALVQRLLEVLAGVRPVAQLQRDTSLELFDRLGQVVSTQPRHRGPRPDRRAVHSLHIQQRPDGVAEVCATVRKGQRLAALALRLEGVNGRWTCMQLDGL